MKQRYITSNLNWCCYKDLKQRPLTSRRQLNCVTCATRSTLSMHNLLAAGGRRVPLRAPDLSEYVINHMCSWKQCSSRCYTPWCSCRRELIQLICSSAQRNERHVKYNWTKSKQTGREPYDTRYFSGDCKFLEDHLKHMWWDIRNGTNAKGKPDSTSAIFATVKHGP